MSKKSEKKAKKVYSTETAIKPKVFRYLVPFVLIFCLLGIIGGSLLGFDLTSLIPAKDEQAEAGAPEESAAAVIYEYISDDGQTAPQYFLKPDGDVEVADVYEIPYNAEVKTFKLVDENGIEVEGYEIKYYDLNENEVEPKACGYYKVVATNADEVKFEREFKIVKSEIELPEGIFEDLTVVYDGAVKILEVDNALLPANVTVYYDAPCKETEAGVYKVNATFVHTADDNYKPTVLTATLTIEKAEQNYDIELENITVDYDGSSHAIDLGAFTPGADKTVTIEYKDASGKTSFDAPINAGTYTATLTVECKNYNDFVKTATIVINKIADTEEIYDTFIKFEGTTLPFNNKNQAIVPDVNEGADAYGIVGKLSENYDCVNAGEYEITATYSSTNYLDKTVTVKLNIEKVDYNYLENGYEFNDKTVIYTGNEQTLELIQPADAPDGVFNLDIVYKNIKLTAVGEYEVKVTIESTNYKDVTYKATLKIVDAKKLAPEKIPFDMKLHKPNIEALNLTENSIKFYLVDADGNLTEVKDGVEKIGNYIFKITGKDAESGAYTEHIIAMNVTFNPILVLVTAAAGLVLGLIVGLICYIFYSKKMKQAKFRHIKEFVIAGPIIAESYAKFCKGYGKGRLYFTGEAMEFYTDIYDNIPYLKINMTEVRSVNCVNHSTFTVNIKNDMYTIKVPKGSANAWVDLLINY